LWFAQRHGGTEDYNEGALGINASGSGHALCAERKIHPNVSNASKGEECIGLEYNKLWSFV